MRSGSVTRQLGVIVQAPVLSTLRRRIVPRRVAESVKVGAKPEGTYLVWVDVSGLIEKIGAQLESTDPGVVKGKFSYLSPEAASGKEVDRRERGARLRPLGIDAPPDAHEGVALELEVGELRVQATAKIVTSTMTLAM